MRTAGNTEIGSYHFTQPAGSIAKLPFSSVTERQLLTGANRVRPKQQVILAPEQSVGHFLHVYQGAVGGVPAASTLHR